MGIIWNIKFDFQEHFSKSLNMATTLDVSEHHNYVDNLFSHRLIDLFTSVKVFLKKNILFQQVFTLGLHKHSFMLF